MSVRHSALKRIVTLLLCGAAFAAGAVDPVLRFPLDDGTGTSLRSDRDGVSGEILHPDGIRWIAGRDRGVKALSFSGKSKEKHRLPCAELPLEGIIDFTNPFTLTFWFNVSRDQARIQQAEIVSNVRSDRGPGFRIVFGWNALSFRTGDGKNIVAASSRGPLDPVERDVWNHCAVTWDGAETGILYLNGVKVAAQKDFQILKGTPSLCLGSYRKGYAHGFNGALSDLRIFDRVLTPAEILAISRDMAE